MKIVGNIVDVLTQGKHQVKDRTSNPCTECALCVKLERRIDCRIPEGMECPAEEGYHFEND